MLTHFDADSDGVLSRTEFASMMEMVAAKSGQQYTSAHVEDVFREADIDRNEGLDLNELLLLQRSL